MKDDEQDALPAPIFEVISVSMAGDLYAVSVVPLTAVSPDFLKVLTFNVERKEAKKLTVGTRVSFAIVEED